MTYQQALDYLYARLPMYQRIGPPAYKANLDNTIKLMEMLGKPHLRLRCIHVAGTNGKGSSSHMIAAIMQQAGYKTGLYTSPHLIDFRERIRINGKMVPKNSVVDFILKHRDAFTQIQPSFFEWTFALAMDYFAQEEVDVAIIETGLGGRLDSTNVIQPKACLITNVSLDHTALLGDSIDKIAREKAGIIKAKIPVVISQYQSESASIFSAVARELKAPVEFADRNFKVVRCGMKKELLVADIIDRRSHEVTQYELDLATGYQLKNLLGVLNLLEFIEKAGFILESSHAIKALRQVAKLTGMRGRWQRLSERPLMIADTAHNEDGIRQIVEDLAEVEYDKLHFVLGTVNDKDIDRMLALLPKKAVYYFVKAAIPRALNAKELCRKAKEHRLSGKMYGSVEAGVKAARKAAGKSDLVFIGGSTFVVGEALEVFGQ